jgi:branched-subunit amino acid ABC-type transport system permease component
MGLSIPAFLIAVQSTVRRSELGAATSAVQFSRSIGGTLGVSVMGAVLAARLAGGLLASGLDPATVSLSALIDPLAQSSATLDDTLRVVLAGAMQGVFWMAFGAAALGLVATIFAPRGRIAQLQAQRPAAEGEREPQPVGAIE